MFYTDKPISGNSEDCLQRSSFSKQLAKAILSYTEKDNFTISLCGEWGSGKTSIINMTIEYIQALTEAYAENERPIIIKFNPWNYSDRTQLISQFFQTVQYTIKTESKNGMLEKVGETLQNYSSIFEYAEYIPIAGKYFKPLKAIMISVGKEMTKKSDAQRNLENQKKEVIKALSSQKQKFIVIIDDIDRLNNEQIRLIFQLVNSIAGFPNMIYLLSFDYNVVVRALEKEQNCNGEEHLEKIIQVPFNIPEAKISLVHEILFKKLEDILFKETPCGNFDYEYWGLVFEYCVAPFIHSIRDVNRVINVYKFKYGTMHDEVNCIDLLALTILQICAPAIYDWIHNNINILAGSYYAGKSSVEMDQYRNEIMEELKNVYPINPNQMLNILQSLFPKFDWNTNGHKGHNEKDAELRRNQRVACADKASLYFSLSLEDVPITKRQILDVTQNYDKNMIESFFEKMETEGKLYEFAKEFLAYIDDIAVDKLTIFFACMLKMQTHKTNYERETIFSPNAAHICNQCCWKILEKVGKSEAEEIIIHFLKTSELDVCAIMLGMVVLIEESYGRIGNSPRYDDRVIDESKLEKIEEIILSILNEYSTNEDLLGIYGFSNIYIMWRYIDKQSLDIYLKKNLKNTDNVLKYLLFCAKRWSGNNETGWFFKEEDFSDYITAADIYDKIICLKNTMEFSNLSIELKEISIAYYLWYNSDRKQYHEISKSMVDELIPEWEFNQ